MTNEQTTSKRTPYSPGPWGISLIGSTARVFGGGISDGNGNQVALVTVPRSGSDSVRKSNARLIAAAPELLNGCNALLGLLQLVNSNRDTPPWIRDALTNNHRIDEARAAVAKAQRERGSEERAGEANVA